MGYSKSLQNYLIGLSLTDENYGMLIIIYWHKCHTAFHIKYKEDLE